MDLKVRFPWDAAEVTGLDGPPTCPGREGARIQERRAEKKEREESANGLRGPTLCIIKSHDDVAECEVSPVVGASKGDEDSRGHASTSKNAASIPSGVAFRPVIRPCQPSALPRRQPSRNSGNKPETPTRFAPESP